MVTLVSEQFHGQCCTVWARRGRLHILGCRTFARRRLQDESVLLLDEVKLPSHMAGSEGVVSCNHHYLWGLNRQGKVTLHLQGCMCTKLTWCICDSQLPS